MELRISHQTFHYETASNVAVCGAVFLKTTPGFSLQVAVRVCTGSVCVSDCPPPQNTGSVCCFPGEPGWCLGWKARLCQNVCLNLVLGDTSLLCALEWRGLFTGVCRLTQGWIS